MKKKRLDLGEAAFPMKRFTPEEQDELFAKMLKAGVDPHFPRGNLRPGLV